MALIKTYTNAGEEFVDAYHVIRNIKIEKINSDGLIPTTEKGFYIIIDVDICKENTIPVIHVGFVVGEIGALSIERENNPVFYIEELEDLPPNIVSYAYSLLKTLPMYQGATDA